MEGIKQNGKGGGASARKEKRAQWWAGNMEKRLSGQDGSAEATGLPYANYACFAFQTTRRVCGVNGINESSVISS